MGMGMQVETRLSDQIARYMDLATAEAKLTAANMANIDTPGYRAVGMDFEAEMRSALEGVDAGTQPRAVRVKQVDGLIARPDGNDVSMDRESLNLAEAQLKFKTGVALLREEYQRVTDAIHVDK
jgi:flagellar basal-body rod protein FlgB